ncbi:von_Willebrand factor type A domain-containing protein [Hexamita inflata]|uniref:von Willebrand factor type A domain-containing protein n=1 Tax=Hexamita inflata TaxID=28002 RepID=A0AA86Q2Z8_9EUKA|nr:von Willebrand factor type A domain-containing protein [Hexamita inflata]
MKEDLMEVVAILDMSGSMSSLTHDTIGGFNAYLSQLRKQAKDIKITLIVFNTQSSVVWNHQNVKSSQNLGTNIYRPDGGTALYDALGTAINNMKSHIQELSEANKPGKVSFFVTTDGEENSSSSYNISQVKQLITKATEDDKWEFMFAGANIDAHAAGQQLGFQAQNIANICNDGVGQSAVYAAMAAKQICCDMEECCLQDIYDEKEECCRQVGGNQNYNVQIDTQQVDEEYLVECWCEIDNDDQIDQREIEECPM